MQSPKVLVVDDDPDIVEYFSSFLEDHGYEVSGVDRSDKALSRLDGFRPDVILIDVMMPGKSGLDLLVNIRRHPRWGDIPLVVVTGNDRVLEDDCQSYLNSHEGIRGPDGVLGKPIDRTTLLAVLRKLTSRSGAS